MGRWGDGIYDSDSALDYFATITDKFERELDYWFSPEKIVHESWWLVQVLPAIEMILLFEGQDMGSSTYLENPEVLERWREAFFGVWDGDWKDTYTYDNPFNDAAYRQQHRPALAAMFGRLSSIARYWGAVTESSSRPELTPLHSDYPLPYFSIKRWANSQDKEIVNIERFKGDLLELLVKDIIYWLSAEKRRKVVAFNIEEVWVAVDVLGFLCEKYEQSAGVNEKAVRNWRTTAIEITKQFLSGNWNESDSLYLNLMAAFDRLETVARKYPPYEW
jgi:hypothetical protein